MCARIVLTGQRQHLQVSHRAQMLQPEVAHLRAPAQEQGGQRQHRGDVADADVGDVHTTAGQLGKVKYTIMNAMNGTAVSFRFPIDVMCFFVVRELNILY